jgi:TRAP transporter TAXI family solute receptor
MDGTGQLGWMTAPDTYFGLKGLLDFEQWGPQSYRVVYEGGTLSAGLVTQGDSGIETLNDMVGRKVTYYPTYPVVMKYMQSWLAYANITYDDVIQIPVSSMGDGMNAVLSGAAEVAFASQFSPTMYELESSFHGIHWLNFPNVTAEDKEAWARLQAILPAWYPYTATTGPGISEENPVAMNGYNYLILAYDWTDENLAYWFAKQMYENYDAFKDKHANLVLYSPEHALEWEFWFCPQHEGTIRYYKDIGKWTAEMEAKQQELLAKYPQTMTKP